MANAGQALLISLDENLSHRLILGRFVAGKSYVDIEFSFSCIRAQSLVLGPEILAISEVDGVFEFETSSDLECRTRRTLEGQSNKIRFLKEGR